METLTQNLIKTLNKNYIFHGSPVQKRSAKNNNDTTLQSVIYGVDNVENAILHAFIKMPVDENFYACWRAEYSKHIVYLKNMYIKEDEKGYIYCFDNKNFFRQESSSQYCCFNKIKPQKVFCVYYKDFRHLFITEKE